MLDNAPIEAVDKINTMSFQHNSIDSTSQEFYLWPLVTQAAKNALEIRLGSHLI